MPDGPAGPIPPIDFAWSFEFDPLVIMTDVQDTLPASFRTSAAFSGAGITTGSTPLTTDIWATFPAGATFKNETYAYGNQAYYSFCICVLRDFSLHDYWTSGDVNADPNVETTYMYARSFGLNTQTAETAADVDLFDASSIIDFLSMAASPGFNASFTEQLRITTWNRTTGEVTSSQTLDWARHLRQPHPWLADAGSGAGVDGPRRDRPDRNSDS